MLDALTTSAHIYFFFSATFIYILLLFCYALFKIGVMQKKSLAIPFVIFIILVAALYVNKKTPLPGGSLAKYLNSYNSHAFLKDPSRIDKLNDDTYLISDSGNKRVIAVNTSHEITWTYPTDHTFSMASQTGKTFLLDDGYKPIEINNLGALTWKGADGYNGISYVQQTPPGTIIYYTGKEIREINKNNALMWHLETTTPFVSVQKDNTILYVDQKHNIMSVSANRSEIWKVLHIDNTVTWAEKATGGIYLVASYNNTKSSITLYNAAGSILKQVSSYANVPYPLFIKPSYVHITPDNTILLTDTSYASEITWDGNVKWQY